jgi:glutamyl-tRNA synthetase
VVGPRLRFAPSPTGYLHVGNARALLFNWLEARREGGEMLLRIEDTDVDRSRPELTDDVLDQIRWLGLAWDGEPTHQSERVHLYAKAADDLLAGGHAYWCDCTAEQVQERARRRGGPPGYDGHCRDRGLAGGAGSGAALRFRVPDEGTTSFDDLVRGQVTFDNAKLEDFVLLRSTGMPTFLLANLVDDVEMGITHVVRGDDHVNGTPKYVLIGQALGLDHRPVFAHLPMLVNEQRKKLSKRRDSVSVAEFRAAGYLPEAMVNYLATLGWGPKDGVEIRPLAEIVDLFRLDDVTPSPAFFDTKKLQHFNATYIRGLDVATFVERARPYFAHGQATEDVLVPIAELVRDRVRLLTDVEPMVDFLRVDEVDVDEESWRKHVARHGDRAAAMLDAAAEALSDCDWTPGAVEAALLGAATAAGFVNAEGNPQMSKAQGPVRVATTGRAVGPPLYESLVVLGRERTLARLRAARAGL